MREFIITSLIIGFAIALALNVLWSMANKLTGRGGQNYSFVRFGRFISTGFVFSIITMLLR